MPKTKSNAKNVEVKWYVQDIFVSVVVVLRAESMYLEQYLGRLSSTLRAHYANYEIIIVANDVASQELEQVKRMLEELPAVRLMLLAREYEIDTAIFAGLDAAIGDYVCTLDQTIDPAEVLPDVIAQLENADIVQGVSGVRMRGNGIGRRMFYWYNRKYMGIDIPLNATYLMAFSRKAVTAITNSSRDHRHIRHLSRVVGFKLSEFIYTPIVSPDKRHGLRSGTVQALETITSYSTHPLRLLSWVGVAASFLNLAYAVYVVVVNLVRNNVAEGWTTTSLQLSTMFFLLFITIVVISEYIGRLLSEQRGDPKYIIDDEFSSTVSVADFERKNISK